MAVAVIQDELFYPVKIRLLSAVAIVECPHLVERLFK